MNFIEEYGYLGLFAFSLIAATIVPISSEGAVTFALFMKLKPIPVLIWATLGNCMGVFFNYIFGWWIGDKWLSKNANKPAFKIAKKYGWWSLLLSWLPFIGDPLTIIAGILKWNLTLFIFIVFSLRFLRYYLIIYFFI